VLATPLLMSLYFLELSGFEPRELPYSNQARYQFSQPSLNLAIHLSNLATHAITQFSHLSQIWRGCKVNHQLLRILYKHWKFTQPLVDRKSRNLFFRFFSTFYNLHISKFFFLLTFLNDKA
jgi:hypothetical protein